MPTGYTADILKNKSFQHFALKCARAFGAYASLRDHALDDDTPTELKVDPYHLTSLKEAEEELKKFVAMSDEELRLKLEDEYAASVIRHLKKLSKMKDETRVYKHYLEMAKVWNPPTDKHIGLKKFMIEQLEETIKSDCYDLEAPKKPSIQQWKQSKIDSLEKDIIYHQNNYEKELLRTKQNNVWIKQLVESF